MIDKKYYEIPKTLAECAYVMLERLTSEDDLNYQRQDMIDSLEFDINSKNLLEQDQELKKSLFLRYLPLNMILVTQVQKD